MMLADIVTRAFSATTYARRARNCRRRATHYSCAARPVNWGALIAALAASFACGAAAADTLRLPQAAERDGTIAVVYRFDRPATGSGFLDIEWTDSVGRIVDRRRLAFDLDNAVSIDFSLDARRAVTIENKIEAHLTLDGARMASAAAKFIAMPPATRWQDFQIIMWQNQTAAGFAALKRLGITAGMVEANHRDESGGFVADQLAPLLQANLRCYLENIATDFYSAYHRWAPNKPENWRFREAKERHRRGDLTAFIRDPSLSDPAWLDRIVARLGRSLRNLQPYRPLYYSLGDETGIADLSAFWDFDLSAHSLAGMRQWLLQEYGSLAALNREWGKEFASWDEVLPMTTAQALQRSDRNYAAWADFKEWMDVSFARALAAGSAAIHAADPTALSAIEGGQIPGWGGYDYSRLAEVVDAMELYDYGDNIELVRSFAPEMVLLNTSGQAGPAEEHRIWDHLLRGTRGLILWDEDGGFVDKDGKYGPRASEFLRQFAEIRGGLGALLIAARQRFDPVGIVYSPESMRVSWLLARKASGEDWTERNASREYEPNPGREATAAALRTVQRLGLQPRFVSSRALPGQLAHGAIRVLLLPQTIALSPPAAAAIRDFVAAGGMVVADGRPGLYDAHGRALAWSSLAELYPTGPAAAPTAFAFGKGKAAYLRFAQDAGGEGMRAILAAAGVRPAYAALESDGSSASDITTRIFENGATTILALQRNFDPADPAAPKMVSLRLPQPLYARDIRNGVDYGKTGRLTFELGTVEPVFLALSPMPASPPSISAPASARLGDTVHLALRSGATAARDILHVDVIDPDGVVAVDYSGNLPAPDGRATTRLPLAVNDKTGNWRIRVRDAASGLTAGAELRVEP
jgi:hypothetical protein